MDMSLKLNQDMLNANIQFDVAGLFVHTDLIIKLIKCVEERLGYRLPIRSIYGATNCIWNGGRFNINPYECDWKSELMKLKENKIITLFTFTNHKIDESDLLDKECNRLLEYVCENKIPCEVRISSKLLKDYIEKSYPNIKINSSVIKVAVDDGVGKLEYYRSLEQEYNKYVVHPDDNFNSSLLSLLDKNKAEILLNERCTYMCLNRKNHYESITELMKYGKNKRESQNRILESCKAIPEIKQIRSNNRNISLSYKEFDLIKKLGFYNFKIQGRIDNKYVYFYDLIRYILPDEFIVSQIYIPFCDIIRQKSY